MIVRGRDENLLATAGFEAERAGLLNAILDRVEAHDEHFELEPATGGLTLNRAARDDRAAGRPRILFFPAGKDRVVAFFYKPSRLHFSRDRFSYGALYLYAARQEAALAEIGDGLDFLAGDFKPALRPKRLKRSLDVTVPGD